MCEQLFRQQTSVHMFIAFIFVPMPKWYICKVAIAERTEKRKDGLGAKEGERGGERKTACLSSQYCIMVSDNLNE